MSTTGVERTLRTLLRSANPAATDLLVTALGSSDSAMRVGAVRALALRADPQGHRQLVERLAQLPPDAFAAVTDIDPKAPLAKSLATMIDAGRPRLARRAIEIVDRWEVTPLLPAVVEAALWPDSQATKADAAVALRLALLLEQQIREYEPRVGRGDEKAPQDPAFARRAAVNALVMGVDRFASHRSQDLLDALLLLSPSDEPALLRALRDESHPAHEALLLSLRTSTCRGALGLLASALGDPRAPQALLETAADRSDCAGLSMLMELVGYPLSLRYRENAARIAAFAWLDPAKVGLVLLLPGPAQAVAISLAAASGASRRQVAALCVTLLREGAVEGRLAACHAIERLPSHLAFEPLGKALEASDPTILASAAKLLRMKQHPQATMTLVGLLTHDDERVRSAAQRSLKELSFASFRDHVDDLPDETQRRVGKLIGKADPLAIASIRAELGAGAVSRRLKALRMIDVMGVAEGVAMDLIERLAGDNDLAVRVEAARLLGAVECLPAVLDALEDAALEAPAAVRRAAEASLARLTTPTTAEAASR